MHLYLHLATSSLFTNSVYAQPRYADNTEPLYKEPEAVLAPMLIIFLENTSHVIAHKGSLCLLVLSVSGVIFRQKPTELELQCWDQRSWLQESRRWPVRMMAAFECARPTLAIICFSLCSARTRIPVPSLHISKLH
jgi:hypothetical protein